MPLSIIRNEGDFYKKKNSFWQKSKNTTIVYKKANKRYIEWQRVTTNDNEWQPMTTSGATSNKRMTTSGTTNDNESQQMRMSGTEWQKMVQRVKTAKLLQRMDDCNSFYNENRYTTSRDGWLILEWLNRLPITSSKKVLVLISTRCFFIRNEFIRKSSLIGLIAQPNFFKKLETNVCVLSN